ncbi:hypothetical protein K501DRAFT_184486 [Backusella circina FSU 941]|nr:hypothetical protein K501DRAFT_184486 [Backusella circina FSU 941]
MDFNSLTTPIDSEWLFSSNSKSDLNDTIEEPVPFEDFKFSFGMGPDVSIPLNSDVFPSAPDPFLQEPPSFPPTAVLDENDQKTFSSFLDTFFMDLDNDQLNDFYSLSSSNGQEEKEEESRQSSILQSLDEQKRLARMNVMASLPNKLTSLSPVHPVIPSPSNSNKDTTPSHSQDTPQSIYLLKSDQVTTPYVRASSKRPPDAIVEVKPVKKIRSTKELLTEDEKRANHIASEQKRRCTIRNGFKDLTELVPTLKNVNNSKSIILFKAVDFIHHLEKRNNGLREKLHSLQVRAQVEGRMTTHSRAQASARKALLVHKAQQEQLLKLQEQLQLHQRLIAERQEMKEKALQSAKRKTAQCDKNNYNILSDLEDKAISAP